MHIAPPALKEASFFRSGVFLSALAAFVSLLLTGYAFGYNNNVFHLPITAALYDLPQFQGDMFMQSLRHFSSGLWMVLTGAETYVDSYWLFLALLFFSRFLTFWGMLYCAEYFGINSFRERLMIIAALVFSKLLYFYSFAGGGGILLNYFTHSELANGITLISLGLILRNKITGGLALNGVVFFINAFVAVWNVLPIGLLLLYKIYQKQMTFIAVIKQGIIGSILLLVFAAPVIFSITQNPTFGQDLTFEYATFLREYYPYHFLFDEIGKSHKLGLLAVILIAAISFWQIGKGGRDYLIILASYIAVYLIGIVLPLVSGSASLLNLHLLRVSTFLHIFAAMGCALLVISWLREKEDRNSAVWAYGLIAVVSLPKAFLLTLPYICLRHVTIFNKFISFFPKRILIAGIGMVMVLSVAVTLHKNHKWLHKINTNNELLYAAGAWAKDNTDVDAIFLIPANDPALTDTGYFHYLAERRIWVSHKLGAAVMWYPPYYAEWRQRLDEIENLKTFPEMVAYGKDKNIDFILSRCVPDVAPVFTYKDFCIYNIGSVGR